MPFPDAPGFERKGAEKAVVAEVLVRVLAEEGGITADDGFITKAFTTFFAVAVAAVDIGVGIVFFQDIVDWGVIGQ